MAQRHCQELYLDPKDVGKQHLKIFPGAPSEILTPWTPGKSQGTKILGSKIFSYQPVMNLFYEFCGLLMLKMPNIRKNMVILPILLLQCKIVEYGPSFQYFGIFSISNPQNS